MIKGLAYQSAHFDNLQFQQNSPLTNTHEGKRVESSRGTREALEPENSPYRADPTNGSSRSPRTAGKGAKRSFFEKREPLNLLLRASSSSFTQKNIQSRGARTRLGNSQFNSETFSGVVDLSGTVKLTEEAPAQPSEVRESPGRNQWWAHPEFKREQGRQNKHMDWLGSY